MIDIVCFEGEKFNLGYLKVYHVSDFNIAFGGPKVNRRAVEDKKTDILVSPEMGSGRDSLTQRDSGLNQVLCALARKNQVAIGFSFSGILNAKYGANLLGKIMQNIRLCRKYKVRMVFASFAKNKFEMRNANDMLAFCRVLGMGGREAKDALNFKKKEPLIKIVE